MEHRLRLGAVWHDNDLVFPSLLGKPWIPRPFYKVYRRIVDESGIEHPQTVNWHTLRHTAASQWLRHGVDVFSVSRRLGHASASFTMDTYAHLLKGQQREAAEALDYLLAQA
jgi:integrase